MTVYVDDMDAPYGRMKMAHLFSDTSLAELHALAQAIGVARRWFQGQSRTPHYDVCRAKKQLALQQGAVEIGCGTAEWRRLVAMARALKGGVS